MDKWVRNIIRDRVAELEKQVEALYEAEAMTERLRERNGALATENAALRAAPPADQRLVEANKELERRANQANMVIDQLNQQVADLQERLRVILAAKVSKV